MSARPFCPGCGYYFVAHGEHRADCTLTSHDIAVRMVQAVLGGQVIHTETTAGERPAGRAAPEQR
jgi:hypothetical protein